MIFDEIRVGSSLSLIEVLRICCGSSSLINISHIYLFLRTDEYEGREDASSGSLV